MRIYILLFFGIVLVGCEIDSRVIVDIEDPQHREKYLEVLGDTDLKYSIMESGKIAIDVENADVLKARMKKYYDYRAMRIRELNDEKRGRRE